MDADRENPTLLDRILPWILALFALLAALGAVARVLMINNPEKQLDNTTLLYLGVAGALLLLREVKTLSFGDYKVEFERIKKKAEEAEKKSEAAIQNAQSAQTTANDAITNAAGVGGRKAEAKPPLTKPAQDGGKIPPSPLSYDRGLSKGAPPSRGLSLDTEATAFDEDPNAGQFGKESERKGRRLSATVAPFSGANEIFEIHLKVESTDTADLLQGTVQFFLHPTFANDRPIVTVGANGTAELTLRAWGAFTVGAVCDKGATRLELDLAELEGAPALFRER